jgi:hypothetical protein
MDAIHWQLDGHRINIANCLESGQKLIPTEDRFIELEEGFWQYSIGYSLLVRTIENEAANRLPDGLIERIDIGGIHRNWISHAKQYCTVNN